MPVTTHPPSRLVAPMISGQGADCVPTYPSSLREGWQPGKFWRRAGVLRGMKGRPAAAVLAARRSPRFRGLGDEADGQGDQVPPALCQRGQRSVVAAIGEVATHHAAVAPGDHTGGGPATGPARTGRDDERDGREAVDGPIVVVVVDEKIVVGRVRQGVRPIPRAARASVAARPLDHTQPRAPHQPGGYTAAR
jgi:hypothetical protein